MDIMKRFINAVKDNAEYEWILNNGYNLTKDELIRIICEQNYAMTHTHGLLEVDKRAMKEELIENLEEHYSYRWEEE